MSAEAPTREAIDQAHGRLDLGEAAEPKPRLFDLGGKRPQTAVLSLTGAKLEIDPDNGPRKGDTITGTFEAVVLEVGQRDKQDAQTGMIVECKQRHVAAVTNLSLDS